jgi:hypothetical protein
VRCTYAEHDFHYERDIVWTMQRQLKKTLSQSGRRRTVFTEYPMRKGARRSCCTDLAILENDEAGLVAEFKYEPAHDRPDILTKRLPVVVWREFLNDITRMQEYVESR